MLNDTIRSILARRSIRSYTSTPVEKDKIDLILQCAQFAPSGMNRQPWHFTVVTNRTILDQISAENKKALQQSDDEGVRLRAQDPKFDSFRGAPMAVIVSAEDQGAYTAADCANTVENMTVAAQSLGLGSCYLGSFKLAMQTPDGAFLLDLLKIPEGYTPLYALAIGYGNEILGERAPRRANTITWIE